MPSMRAGEAQAVIRVSAARTAKNLAKRAMFKFCLPTPRRQTALKLHRPERHSTEAKRQNLSPDAACR